MGLLIKLNTNKTSFNKHTLGWPDYIFRNLGHYLDQIVLMEKY